MYETLEGLKYNKQILSQCIIIIYAPVYAYKREGIKKLYKNNYRDV